MEKFLAIYRGDYYLVPLASTKKWGNRDFILKEFKQKRKQLFIRENVPNGDFEEHLIYLEKTYQPYFNHNHFSLDYRELEGLKTGRASIFNYPDFVDYLVYFDPITREFVRIIHDYRELGKYNVYLYENKKMSGKNFKEELELMEFIRSWARKRKIRRLLLEC